MKIFSTGTAIGFMAGLAAAINLGEHPLMAVGAGTMLSIPVSLAVTRRTGRRGRTPDVVIRENGTVFASGAGWAVRIPEERVTVKNGVVFDIETGRPLFKGGIEATGQIPDGGDQGPWARAGNKVEALAILGTAAFATVAFAMNGWFAGMGALHGAAVFMLAARRMALGSGPFASLENGELVMKRFLFGEKRVFVRDIREIGLRWQGVGGLDRGVPFVRTDRETITFSWFEGAGGKKSLDFVAGVSRAMALAE